MVPVCVYWAMMPPTRALPEVVADLISPETMQYSTVMLPAASAAMPAQ